MRIADLGKICSHGISKITQSLSRSAMRKSFVFILFLCAFLASFAFVDAVHAENSPTLVPFNIGDDSRFPVVKVVLSRLISVKKADKHDNTFCIIGYKDTDMANAWVYWPQGHALILWEPQSDLVADLALSNRYLDLKRDVVETEGDVGGSSYLVTRAWVSGVLSDCEKSGLKESFKKHIR